jgi:hypothetical protein
MTLKHRDRERGAVALLIAVMWTALFGMAVVAVDFGYLYTKKRGLQDATDAALKSAMPIYQSSGFNAAASRARQVAQVAGYVDGGSTTVTIDEPVIGTQLRVRIGRQHPTFFGGVFGIGARTITAGAIGQLLGSAPAPAILATGACGSGSNYGMTMNGDTNITVHGDVESNGRLNIQGGGVNTYKFDGNVQAAGAPATCANSPLASSSPMPPVPLWMTFLSGSATQVGPAFTDPLLTTAMPACTVGDLVTPWPSGILPASAWTFGPACPAGTCYIKPGVYCGLGDVSITTADFCQCINTDPTVPLPNGVTIIATGSIGISGNNGGNLRAYTAGNPGNVLFNARGANNCMIAPQAFFFGWSNNFTLQGTIYAPNGCANISSGTGMTFTGSIIGKEVSFGMGAGPFTINGPSSGGGGPTGWRVLQ